MGRPRTWTDAQRAALFDLYKQGLPSKEIAERCADGLASVAPFRIPDRTVRDICKQMAAERVLASPATLEEASAPHAVETVPGRVQLIVERELVAIERRQEKGRMRANDPATMAHLLKLHKQLGRPRASSAPAPSSSTEDGTGDSLMERLRRERERQCRDSLPSKPPVGPVPPPAPIETTPGRDGAPVVPNPPQTPPKGDAAMDATEAKRQRLIAQLDRQLGPAA